MRSLRSAIDDRLRPLMSAVAPMSACFGDGLCLPTLISELAVTPSARLKPRQRRHLDILCRKVCAARALWSQYDDSGRRATATEPLAEVWKTLLAGVLLAHAGELASSEEQRRGAGLSRLNAALRLLDGIANDTLQAWANDLLRQIAREQPV